MNLPALPKKSGIVCTIGPASNSDAVLRAMVHAGMDFARLNFSHESHVDHGQRIAKIRRAAKTVGRRVKILQDLEGFRIRICRLPQDKPITLRKGQRLTLCNDGAYASSSKVTIDYPGSLKKVKRGAEIFIDDGNIMLKAMSSSLHALETRVVIPGNLKSRKGLNIPSFNVDMDGLTPKDTKDLAFGLSHRIDAVAQSFVTSRMDVIKLKEQLKGIRPRPLIIAKIENRQGLDNFDEILREVDGIMIARGDLGVLIPLYQVPIVQKIIINKCRRAGKFAITATQMLESMTQNPRPTRAEVSDVANALLDGSHYMMLSAETAAGQYPVESVATMRRILDYTRHALPELRRS